MEEIVEGMRCRIMEKSSRRCVEIIECDNPTCNIIVRPQTTPNEWNLEAVQQALQLWAYA